MQTKITFIDLLCCFFLFCAFFLGSCLLLNLERLQLTENTILIGFLISIICYAGFLFKTINKPFKKAKKQL